MRVRVREGFTIIELLIYILFFAFIAMATGAWMVRLWQASAARNSKQEALIMLYTAHDMLLRDITHASVDCRHWKEMQAECIIWHTKRGDVGWWKENGSLVRATGRYNKQKKQWSSYTKNLIVDHVDAVRFAHEGEREIAQILFSIITGNQSVRGVATPNLGRSV